MILQNTPLGRFAKRRGLSKQQEVGDAVGLSQALVSRLESGDRGLSIARAIQLSEITGEPLAEIVAIYCSESMARLADLLAGAL